MSIASRLRSLSPAVEQVVCAGRFPILLGGDGFWIHLVVLLNANYIFDT